MAYVKDSLRPLKLLVECLCRVRTTCREFSVLLLVRSVRIVSRVTECVVECRRAPGHRRRGECCVQV